jgi:excisionase family DNA binding protein
MADSFLTVAGVAELLKVNQQTVRNWIDRGELTAVRVGQRRVRVRQSDLDRFIEDDAAVDSDPEPGRPTLDQSDVHRAVADASAGGPDAVLEALSGYSLSDAAAIIDAVIADFIAELNRALMASGGPYGLDGAAFMRCYDALWTAKLNLR